MVSYFVLWFVIMYLCTFFVCARIIPRDECFDTHLQQKREGKMELMFLCMKKVKNIYSKVAAA